MQKGGIRNLIKETLNKINHKTIEKKSKLITKKLLDLQYYKNAKNIGIYHSIFPEVSTQEIIFDALQNKKNVSLPYIKNNVQLSFKKVTNLNNLKIGKYGILEPNKTNKIIAPEQLDVIIIPSIATDILGNRLGRGAGYFDRYLKEAYNAVFITLCYEEQVFKTITFEEHDVTVDIIVTEKKLLTFPSPKYYKTKLLDGRFHSKNILENVKKEISLKKYKICLAILLVGNDPASLQYISMKIKKCHFVGITTKLFHFDVSKKEEIIIIETILKLNIDKKITGIVIQLPVPSHINSEKIINLINHHKDVDGLTNYNRHQLKNKNEELACCTPKGIIKLFELCKISLKNKKICLIGYGFLVGKPLSIMLKNRSTQVLVCDENTQNIKEKTKTADIVISATGVPHFIDNTFLQKDTVVIDAGTSKLNNKIVGDVNFYDVIKKVKKITPVPGGVGPMTIAMLMENLLNIKRTQE